jgi:hypothetical protein
MNLVKKKLLSLATLIFFIAPMQFSYADEMKTGGQWELAAEIYLWTAGIKGDLSNGASLDMPFSDIWDNLEFAAMAALFAKNGDWSVFADFVYMDLENRVRNSTVGMKSFITTFGGGYRVYKTPDLEFNIIGGARYAQIKNKLNTPLFTGTVSEHLWDGIVGFQGSYNFNEDWFATLYADIGTGQSDLTWQTIGALNYRITSSADAALGYRYLDYEMDSGSAVDNLNISGPYLGVKFHF